MDPFKKPFEQLDHPKPKLEAMAWVCIPNGFANLPCFQILLGSHMLGAHPPGNRGGCFHVSLGPRPGVLKLHQQEDPGQRADLGLKGPHVDMRKCGKSESAQQQRRFQLCSTLTFGKFNSKEVRLVMFVGCKHGGSCMG